MSLSGYLLTAVFCCLLMLLFAFIQYLRPASDDHFFNISTVIIPFSNSQAHKLNPNVKGHIQNVSICETFWCSFAREEVIFVRTAQGPVEYSDCIKAPGLEHSNSLARSVAIITMSVFVFLCTTFYQTLLLSMQGIGPL